MPFKHNAARRHHIPQARYRVTIWAAYEAGLRRRGDLTVRVDESALAGWQAPRRSTPGGQPRYSEMAIELVLTLRLVFHLALRQAEAFARSVLHLLGITLPVPDHSTLSRRGRAFAGRQPRVQPGSPMHLVLDSTGLELFGQGEWCAAALAASRARGGDALLHTLADDVALHLGEGGLDLQESAAHRRRGVERSVERPEADAARFQFVHEADQLAGEPAEAVEIEHDQHVAVAEIVEARLEAGPLDAGAAAAVVIDALAAGGAERVRLAIEHLLAFTGGHPGIPDQFHRSPTPSVHDNPLRYELIVL